MSNKDFLDQFSGNNNKPASFQEEERVKVEKNKNPINVKLIVIIALVVLLIGGAIAFFVLRPTITVKDFVGQKASEVTAWIRQNEIETNGVIFKEEYSFDFDKDTIISQSVDPDTKIRKNAKIDFVVSLGANPEDKVDVPNLQTMGKEEIQDWIKENKLTKTKVMSAYNDEVEEGGVISIDFKNADETSFSRSSTLTITVSKGPKPASVIEVPDFVKKHYSEVETWAKNNKIELTKIDSFSDKIEKDCVISQSMEPKKEIKEGSVFSIVVSKGKGITIPNLKSMNKEDVEEYIKENAGFINRKERYSISSDYVLSQSVPGGSVVDDSKKVDVVINLGNTFYLKDIGINGVVGTRLQTVIDAFNNNREKGIDGFVGEWTNPERVYSEKYKTGVIVSASAGDTKGNTYDINDRLPLDIRINVVVSKGLEIKLELGSVVESGKFIRSKLADVLATNEFVFDNDSHYDYCDLYLNGKKMDPQSTEIIVRQDMKIELREYSE